MKNDKQMDSLYRGLKGRRRVSMDDSDCIFCRSGNCTVLETDYDGKCSDGMPDACKFYHDDVWLNVQALRDPYWAKFKEAVEWRKSFGGET